MKSGDFKAEFTFDHAVGELRWKVGRKGRGCAKGAVAGTVNRRTDTAYKAVTVDGRKHYVHRVIWEMHHGAIPAAMCIDHIDGNGLNNRLENLRLVTLSANQRNSRLPRNNKTGAIGIYPTGARFRAQINNKHVGIFDDLESAVAARVKAQEQLGFHPNHGRTK